MRAGFCSDPFGSTAAYLSPDIKACTEKVMDVTAVEQKFNSTCIDGEERSSC